ncbi:MAG: oligoendopeptidase F [Firmicutes bacterium]|nr:oligoendopeptidase F [Bacillota bacterium]
MSQKENKWELSHIYESHAKWENDIDEVKKLTQQIVEMNGSITTSAQDLLKALKTNDKLYLTLAKAYSYARLQFDTDMGNDAAKARFEKTDALASSVSDRLAFFEPQLLQINQETFEQYKKDISELETYAHSMEKLFQKKKHVLTPEMEEVLAKMASLGNSFKKVFDDITVNDLVFPELEDEEGNTVVANEANYRKCLNSYNRDFREKYFKALLSTYGSHQNSISSTYYGSVKYDVFMARSRKYKSSRAMALSGNFIPLEVYDNLIKTVRENIRVLQDYIALRKKVLGLDNIHFYDLFVPLVEEANISYTFEDAKALVLEALSILGEDYVQTLKKAFDDHWIDIYPKKGKRSGAYAMGIYDSHPYCLLNFSGTLDDVFTLAHELGHVMHSYYSNTNQPFTNAQYTIFTAEVASTVNETILYHHLLQQNKSKREKTHLVSMHLDSLRSTLFRQTFFADFEMQVHDMVEHEKPITPQTLKSMYEELYNVYHGTDFIVDKELNYEWLRIPHFYRAFYVYQYATGVSAAISIAGKILSGKQLNGNKSAIDGYKEFLKSGGSDYSINLLKKAGVDMSSPQPILDAINDFDKARRELEEII